MRCSNRAVGRGNSLPWAAHEPRNRRSPRPSRRYSRVRCACRSHIAPCGMRQGTRGSLIHPSWSTAKGWQRNVVCLTVWAHSWTLCPYQRSLPRWLTMVLTPTSNVCPVVETFVGADLPAGSEGKKPHIDEVGNGSGDSAGQQFAFSCAFLCECSRRANPVEKLRSSVADVATHPMVKWGRDEERLPDRSVPRTITTECQSERMFQPRLHHWHLDRKYFQKIWRHTRCSMINFAR